MSMNTSSGLGCSGISQQPRKISNQNIQVYVRVRPLNSRERQIRSAEVIDVISPREIVTRHTFDSKLTKKFTFDRTFGTDSRQVEVYSTVVAPLIEEVLSGYNCTVFAYGQTGTGKTHTMVGNECAELKSSWEDDSDIGIIPRALSHLFDELRMMEMEFSMRISYLELYNEELCDLLSSDDSVKIRIFDDTTKKGSVIIQGLEEIPVHSKDDVYKLLEKGKERRKTATTLMNAQSSRSHTVFSILVHIRENGIDGEEMLKIGKLNLVDLAGSENVSKAGNEKGIRVRETVNINQSLLTLGRVITALVERTPHIPYRESKLTRLLQESLGGRTKTSIIATISPGHKDIEETLSTLEYAHRAKNIQNKPEVNQKLTKKTVLKEYTEEIDKLKRDLMAARDKNGIYLAEETYNEMTLKMDSQNRELNEKMLLLKALKDEMQNKEKIFNEVSLNLVEKMEELKRTEQNLTQTKGALNQTKKVLNETKRRYKEKKYLLDSHVKTEEELTNQATQILEVADTATKDTHQLHSTIERRRDVDQKIQTACERFTQNMHDHFELMNENLDNLQDHHKTYSQMIIEEFSYTTSVHNKLLKEASEKVKTVNKLNEISVAATCEASEKFSKIIGELSSEHKSSLEKFFQEFKDKQLELKSQIESNLSDVEMYNKQQKTNIDTMRESIVQTLQRCTSDLEAHTKQLHSAHIKPIVDIAEARIQDLMKLQKQMAKERSIADREQSIMNEFVERMLSIKNERLEFANEMSTLNAKLDKDNLKSIAMLKKSSECTQNLYVEQAASNKIAEEELEKQAMATMLCADNNLAKCTTLKTQLNTLSEENNSKIDQFVAAEISHFYQTQQNLAANESEMKRRGMECKNQITDACVTVEAGLAQDTQQLKKHIAVANGFTNSLQHQVTDYARLYKEQMSNCVRDVNKFKQNELKTYTPTGTTPSKREYIYPRKLVATSPHSQIVKRFRQENDWSDLDTTATIEEVSEDEQEHQQISVVQDISSNVEVVLNSTPIDSPEIVVLPQQCSVTNNRNLTVLKPQPLLCNSSLTSNKSPRKPSPRHMTSSLIKANKENV